MRVWLLLFIIMAAGCASPNPQGDDATPGLVDDAPSTPEAPGPLENDTVNATDTPAAPGLPRNVTSVAWNASAEGDLVARFTISIPEATSCQYTYSASGHRPDARPVGGVFVNGRMHGGGSVAAQAQGEHLGLAGTAAGSMQGSGSMPRIEGLQELAMFIHGRDVDGLRPATAAWTYTCDLPFDIVEARRSAYLELYNTETMEATTAGGALLVASWAMDGVVTEAAPETVRAFLHAGGVGPGTWTIKGPGVAENIDLLVNGQDHAAEGAEGQWTSEIEQAAAYSDGLWGGFMGLGVPNTTGFA